MLFSSALAPGLVLNLCLVGDKLKMKETGFIKTSSQFLAHIVPLRGPSGSAWHRDGQGALVPAGKQWAPSKYLMSQQALDIWIAGFRSCRNSSPWPGCCWSQQVPWTLIKNEKLFSGFMGRGQEASEKKKKKGRKNMPHKDQRCPFVQGHVRRFERKGCVVMGGRERRGGGVD